MARHYSTRSFFRQMPNDLLARYFKVRGLFEDLDFARLEETQPEELFAAWLELSEEQRNAMEAELQEISEMSCEKGVSTILDEARVRYASMCSGVKVRGPLTSWKTCPILSQKEGVCGRAFAVTPFPLVANDSRSVLAVKGPLCSASSTFSGGRQLKCPLDCPLFD